MEQLILPVDDTSVNIEFAEFLRGKLSSINHELDLLDKQRQEIDKREAEIRKQQKKFEGYLNAVKESLSNGNMSIPINSKNAFSPNMNANDLLRYIITTSEKPLTTGEVMERYLKFPKLKKPVVMNTSKVSTRLSRIAEDENSEIVRRERNGRVFFISKSLLEE